MKVPAGLLDKHFGDNIVRGAILRFEFDDWDDPSKSEPGPKFAIILNNPAVTDPIYLALTTSKVDKYAKFSNVVLTIEPGDYSCFPVKTAITFLRNPVEVARHKLNVKIHEEKLQFFGVLSKEHMAQIDKIISDGIYISAKLIPFIMPLPLSH